MKNHRFVFLIIATIASLSGAARAAESPFVSADYLQARLIGPDAAGDAPFTAAVDVRLAEGWHAYWRTPGDAGLAPVFDWTGSANLDKAIVAWPAPHRIDIMGLQNFGYENGIVFPVTVTPADPAQAIDLKLAASIMVCRDVCVPQDIALALSIPAGSFAGGKQAAIIARAIDKVPAADGATNALTIDTAVIGPDALVVRAFSQQGFDNADLFVEAGNDVILVARPDITPDADDPRRATLKIAKPESVDNLAQTLSTHTVTLTLVAGGKAIEKAVSF